METWFLIIASLCICAILKSLLGILFPPKKKSNSKLPPGPSPFPIIGNPVMLFNAFQDMEDMISDLHTKYGPIITLHIGSRPAIFIADRFLAHQALVQNGIVFADRPRGVPDFVNINSSIYGSTWRLLRRNLTSEIFNPLRVKSYSSARRWVLDILINSLKSRADSDVPVGVMEPFTYSMFCLLVLMCYGDKLDEKQIKKIELVHHRLLVTVRKFNVLGIWPRLGRILFLHRWRELLQLRNDRDEVLLPLIRARRKLKEGELLSRAGNEGNQEKHEHALAYVDTLFDLDLPDKKRKLKDNEIVTLCSEFLIAGVDTTSTSLQWIMANLVKYQHIQEKLYNEIKEVVQDGEDVKEEDLQKMKYLKAVIFEGLRLHPPGHFLLPHAVSEDTELAGYLIPKNATINFMIGKIGKNPEAWDDHLLFKPERFLNDDGNLEGPDITGTKEIKMMPFGVGRRICPGMTLATLHLEYFVANLVWHFLWKPVDQEEVDLAEKVEFTVVMKNPLQAHIFPRT